MAIDATLKKKIDDVSLKTPDPERAGRNLLRFVEQAPADPRVIEAAAGLFSVSQFLANYCIANPDELYSAVSEIKEKVTKEFLEDRTGNELVFNENMTVEQMMRALRLFRKRYMLRITLRDLSGETDIQSSMKELTVLAEVIISISLQWSLLHNRKKFGPPAESEISIVALGKLGGEELNYSSDIDLIAVYDNDEGQTAGVPNPSGIIFNRISNHEFYCKVVEFCGRLLSANTEEGIAYRVDLRLRPQGQKGDITLPLKAYRTYYESWGRTWERMALIRARPVAGDAGLGRAFLDSIRPFVWKRTMDFAEIEEIRGLKRQIDSSFERDDIKRGYGGIREAEFFIQTFQLLYAGENDALKTVRILNAIQALIMMKMVPEEDLTVLWENYLYLRRVEHYLQMREDLQTHTLPSSGKEMDVLAKVMGFQEKSGFLAGLRLRRMQIKNMYNSLLGTEEDVHAESLNLLEGNLNDHELSGYLLFRGVKDAERSTAFLKGIREHMEAFRTMQERSMMRAVLPQLLERSLTSESPDRALAGLENLISNYRIKPAHLNAIKEQPDLMNGIVRIFALSPYISKIFLSNQYYLDILIEEWSILKTLRVIEERLGRAVSGDRDLETVLAGFRRFEEVRTGILFLQDILKVEDLFRGLSRLAEAIIGAVLNAYDCRDLAVIALGKLGGREMTFGSDLDIIFVSGGPDGITEAEKVLRTLTAYTDMGQIYSVDTRLRPDGSKGILAKDIEGYRAYYMKNARNWEIQALLKARPVGGNQRLARSFINMAKDVILQRGKDIRKEHIAEMRSRIVTGLAHESKGLNIKLGPGGIEEIEFYIQFLQIRNAREFPEVLVQNTAAAISRLAKKQIISPPEKTIYHKSYKYYRKIQTFLRLNEEDMISEGALVTGLTAGFMKHKSQKEFLARLKKVRQDVLKAIGEI